MSSPPRPSRLARAAVSLACLSPLSFGATACDAPEVARSSLAFEDCADGEGRCARLARPVDRAKPEGAQLELFVRVLPSRRQTPEPDPVYVLVGGPGQAAAEVGPMLAPVLDRLRADRDIVLLDQRGTGSSAPLDCDFPDEALAEMLTSDFPEAELRRCLESYEHDPRHFLTEDAVADLEALRQAMGHPKINLIGMSYGTRMGLAYMRRHAEVVRTAVLDGMAPPNRPVPVAMDAGMQAQLEQVLADCKAEPRCDEAFPRLGPRTAAWIAYLDEAPVRVQIRHPRTGVEEQLELDGDVVTGVLRGALYSPLTAALIPLALDRAMAGDYGPLIALSTAAGDISDTISRGMFLSIVCSEDARVDFEAPSASASAGAAKASDTPAIFAGRMAEPMAKACALWPKGEPPEDFAAPVKVDTATLVLSGGRDPATPARWGAEAAKQLPNSTHIVVPAAGHGTWSSGCVSRLITDFVSAGEAAGLDRGCVEGIALPPPFISSAGPAMRGRAEAAQTEGQP